MSATLKLSGEGVGIELRGGTFDIDLDGVRVGSIEWHETEEVTIKPGHHTCSSESGGVVDRPPVDV